MSVCLIYFTHIYKRQNETAEITRGDIAGTHHNPRACSETPGDGPVSAGPGIL